MGQVEFNIMGSLKNLENSVLIHKDDINDINALILVRAKPYFVIDQQFEFIKLECRSTKNQSHAKGGPFSPPSDF